MVILHKLIITNKYLRYTPVWFWYRLINHEDYRLDDRFLYQDFWNSICEGQTQMMEDDKWMTYFGAKAEKIVLPKEDFDALVEKLNEPPDTAIMERLKQLMNRKAPWEKE